MVDGDLAQSISCPIVCSFLVLQSEFEGGQCTYPLVASGIEVRRGKDIHQWIVVSQYHEWRISEVLLEMISDAPLEGKELKLRAAIVFLQWHQGVTPKCDRVIVPIILFLGQHSTQPLFGGISLQEEWFVKIREHQHGSGLDLIFQNSHCFLCLRWQLCWTHFNFFSKYVIEWPGNVSKSLNKAPVMTHESAECTDLGEGLWHQEPLHYTHVFLTGADPLVRNMMCKVYDL